MDTVKEMLRLRPLEHGDSIFFKLPREIRNHIYGYAFTDDAGSDSDAVQKPKVPSPWDPLFDDGTNAIQNRQQVSYYHLRELDTFFYMSLDSRFAPHDSYMHINKTHIPLWLFSCRQSLAEGLEIFYRKVRYCGSLHVHGGIKPLDITAKPCANFRFLSFRDIQNLDLGLRIQCSPDFETGRYRVMIMEHSEDSVENLARILPHFNKCLRSLKIRFSVDVRATCALSGLVLLWEAHLSLSTFFNQSSIQCIELVVEPLVTDFRFGGFPSLPFYLDLVEFIQKELENEATLGPQDSKSLVASNTHGWHICDRLSKMEKRTDTATQYLYDWHLTATRRIKNDDLRNIRHTGVVQWFERDDKYDKIAGEQGDFYRTKGWREFQKIVHDSLEGQCFYCSELNVIAQVIENKSNRIEGADVDELMSAKHTWRSLVPT
jgi:hypothetical protein